MQPTNLRHRQISRSFQLRGSAAFREIMGTFTGENASATSSLPPRPFLRPTGLLFFKRAVALQKAGRERIQDPPSVPAACPKRVRLLCIHSPLPKFDSPSQD